MIKIVQNVNNGEEKKTDRNLTLDFFSKIFKINVRFSKSQMTIERSGKIVKIRQKLPLKDF